LNNGDRWFNIDTGDELVYITDSGGSQWVQPLVGGNFYGQFLALTGGTVTGPTNFTGGLSANTISGNTLIITNNIDSVGRTLKNSSNADTIDWNNNILIGTTANAYWDNGQLKDSGPQLSIDWPNRTLNDTNEDIVLDWQNKIMLGMTNIESSTISATTISGGTLYGDGSNLTGIGGGSFITGNTASIQVRRTTLYSLTLSFSNVTFNVT
jgi:hypothetical protein